MGKWFSERLGQPFVIEKRPMAGTNIGAEVVVHAPDYTLLWIAGQSAQRGPLGQASVQFRSRYCASGGRYPVDGTLLIVFNFRKGTDSHDADSDS
jgi:hypothetical protein